MSYIFQTDRLGFRRYRALDGERLAPVFADPYAARFYPAMERREGIERWINWNLKNYDDFGFGLWALELVCSGVFIGDAGITYQTVQEQRVLEVGWHIHKDFRAQGYATEAGKACLKFGFNSLRATSLSSIVDPENIASIKVASRVHEMHGHYQGKGGRMLLYYTRAPSAAKPIVRADSLHLAAFGPHFILGQTQLNEASRSTQTLGLKL